MDVSSSWCKTGSWSMKLYNILRPAPQDSVTPMLASSYSRLRHSPGDIWKHIFSTSIYHDLACFSLGNSSLRLASWRRFVRVEHIGLSGVVLYEIPVKAAISEGQKYAVSQGLTLESVFGDLSDPDTVGMDLDDLLDAVGAKMVYFPAYACTSFIVGQVMSAFFKDQPGNCPFPAYYGFSIRLREKDLERHVTTFDTAHDGKTVRSEISDHDKAIAGLSDVQLSGENQMISMSLEADSPYTSLCVRTSTLHDLGQKSHGDIDYLASTAGTTGPITLPDTFSRSTQTLYTYDDIVLSFLDFALGNVDL